MTRHAKGEFEVSIVPQTYREVKGLNRMTIDKQFKGDLDAVIYDLPESSFYKGFLFLLSCSASPIRSPSGPRM